MALRDQPYIPLYVQDYLTDEKLNLCSLEAQGVYIKIMCLMHKSEKYGTILLKQKDKQKESTCLNFAYKIAKLLPINENIIGRAIAELVEEDVLQINDDELQQKRMIKDNELSLKRSLAGRKGGKKSSFAKANTEAKYVANSEYENENENNSISNTNYKNSKTPDTLDFVPEPIPSSPHLIFNAEDLKIELLNSYEQIEKIMKAINISEDKVRDYIVEFVDEQDAKDDLERPLNDIRRHLVSWIKIEIEKKNRNEQFNSKAKKSAWEKLNSLQ